MKSKISVVHDPGVGLYLWQLPSGEFLCDDDNNYLNIRSEQGDITKIKRLVEVARALGYSDGKAVWRNGRQISDREYEEQVERLAAGYIPDPHGPSDV